MLPIARYAVAAILVAGCTTRDAAPAADAAGATDVTTLMTDLLRDVSSVETKIVDLAGAIPENRYSWRPDSARTVRQVLLHVAADNYLLPSMLGFAPDASTGIVAGDYSSGGRFEARELSRDSVVAELRRSFVFLRQSMGNVPPASLTAPVTMFGQPFTGQSAWILTVTHLHEHLGQLIAYARTNGVKPPWS